jgi:Tfp pilus assembly protein PilV
MSRANGRCGRGSTLLEVAIALGILAMCGLGLMSTQLGLARHAQLAAARERAAFAAEALAEAARAPTAAGGTGTVAQRWTTLTATIVPEGRLATANAAGDASVATATWLATRFVTTSASAAMLRQASCIDTTVPAGRECVAVAFLR